MLDCRLNYGENAMNWPNNADGDVLRRMQTRGFDFDMAVWIDFDIDFHDENIPPAAKGVLENKFLNVEIIADGNYIKVQIRNRLTYALVTETQDQLTQLMAPYGGYCECWGVLWKPDQKPN
jgi:hypothetical protein